MKQHLLSTSTALIAGVMLSFGVAFAAEHDHAKGEHADNQFLMDAAKGGMAEVTLGRMAAQQGKSDEVKKFGQRMVDDHGKANAELKTLAASEGVTLPTTMDKHAEELQSRLAKLSGDEFDRAYMKEMVKDHKKDVAEFEKHAAQSSDPEVKQWAEKTLPTLKEHLAMAQTTAEKVGVQMSAADEASDKDDAQKMSATHPHASEKTSAKMRDAGDSTKSHTDMGASTRRE